MTKQEEVDRILTLYTGKTGIHLDGVKRELSKAGVVIKVDRVCGSCIGGFTDSVLNGPSTVCPVCHGSYKFVAVEPLVAT